MIHPAEVLNAIRVRHRMPAGELVTRLGISRPTLMRSIRSLGDQVISLGRARRTAYAARRGLRGRLEALPIYSIDRDGTASEVAMLFPTHPQGCAVRYKQQLDWPLDAGMEDGWFDGLPYFIEDMRPQGFLGRQLARAHASVLQVPDEPRRWSEDDVMYALSILGSDQPGCHVLGEQALRTWLDQPLEATALEDRQIKRAYPELASAAMAGWAGGSSAGGEFPKFTALRRAGDQAFHVLVKFSGSDQSPGTVRWSDLLVCEHLAGVAVREHMGIDAAHSTVYQFGERTLLEVRRFDRHGARGRSPVCSWYALNGGLFGIAPGSWVLAASALAQRALVDPATQAQIVALWHFGQLIGNTDMHDGNLSFLPGLKLAPAYDMLPMLYAPERGVELPERKFAPKLPLPAEREAWTLAHAAAQSFWAQAAVDARISRTFRAICARNLEVLGRLRA